MRYLRTLILVICPLFSEMAFAGAWVAGEKKGELIFSQYIPQTEAALESETDFFAEYGLSNRNSLVLSGSILNYGEGNNGSSISLGFKRQLLSNNLKLSLQAGILSSKIDKYHDDEKKYELRIMAGQSFSRNWWYNIEYALRSPKDNETSAFEFGIGRNFSNGGFLIAKYLIDDFALSKRIEKAQISYVMPINKKWLAEIGFRKDFGGYDDKENSGIMAGIWYRF